MKIDLSTRLKAFLLILNIKYFLLCITFSVLFILAASVLINIQNVINISQSTYMFEVRMKLLFYIIFGIFTTLSQVDDFFLLVTAILFGVNMGIIIGKLKIMRDQGKLGLVFGAGIVSLVSAGCAACGLSLLSFIGLGAVLLFLPFHGIEFYILSIGVLLWCLYLNLGAYTKACKLN